VNTDAMRDALPYAMTQRLRLIDMLAEHYGTVNRQPIVDFFGVSTPQASKDFALYQELAPANLHYDLKAKAYRRTDAFARVWP
jgi:hypothetical protein